MPAFPLGAYKALVQPGTSAAAGEREPLLVFLHGAGERGGDAEPRIKRHGPWEAVNSLPAAYHGDAIAAMRRFRVLGLHIAQADGDWDVGLVNQAVTEYLGAHPEVDGARVSLTGLSRGGRGVLRLAIHRRQQGQAVRSIAAFCPEGGNQYSAQEIGILQQIPIYFFHAPSDDMVGYDGTEALRQAIGSATSRLRTIQPEELAFPKFPHVCWTYVYGNPELYFWLLEPPAQPGEWPPMVLPYVSAG